MMSLTSSVNRPVHTPLPSLGEEFFVTNTSLYEDSHSHPSSVHQVAGLRRQGNASQQHPEQSHLLTGTDTPPQRGVFHSPQEMLRSHPFVTINTPYETQHTCNRKWCGDERARRSHMGPAMIVWSDVYLQYNTPSTGTCPSQAHSA